MADSSGAGFPTTNIQRGHLFFDQDDRAMYMYIDGPPILPSSWKLLSGVFASNPDTISTWGEKQTGATWWSLAQGCSVAWNGSSVVGSGGLIAGIPLIQNAPATSSVYTQAHGLGAIPTLVTAYYECLSANFNYSVGDRVVVGAFGSSNAAGDGFDIQYDATNIRVLTGSNVAVVIQNKTAPGLWQGGTAAAWRIVVTPYL